MVSVHTKQLARQNTSKFNYLFNALFTVTLHTLISFMHSIMVLFIIVYFLPSMLLQWHRKEGRIFDLMLKGPCSFVNLLLNKYTVRSSNSKCSFFAAFIS